MARLDRHGIGTEMLPDEAGVPSFLDALDTAQPGWPHALSTLDVREVLPYYYKCLPDGFICIQFVLQFYLDLASSSVKTRLSAREGKGKSKPFAISRADSSNISQTVLNSESEIDIFILTLKNLLEDIKDKAALRTGHKRIKKGETWLLLFKADAHLLESRIILVPSKYALHRSIGNIDVFTSAAEISSDDTALQSRKAVQQTKP